EGLEALFKAPPRTRYGNQIEGRQVVGGGVLPQKLAAQTYKLRRVGLQKDRGEALALIGEFMFDVDIHKGTAARLGLSVAELDPKLASQGDQQNGRPMPVPTRALHAPHVKRAVRTQF